ncbi:hypothetical protein RHMOL_Rhmol04G0142000 [Rhododendron molle]|uniref:Uncharacterized protein n=1 Tax=Rhododendron molle TaxID=49168 RepID=A0ACC0P1H1_RHOML|nr:hypothetical protein RHMOL_Rhmol04G0142000 [Rhododendron molle]
MIDHQISLRTTPKTSIFLQLDDCVLCKLYKTRKATANPENNHEDQEDEEMQVQTPNEEWPNTKCLDKNQQCSHNGDEEMLLNAENPRNIQQCNAQGMHMQDGNCQHPSLKFEPTTPLSGNRKRPAPSPTSSANSVIGKNSIPLVEALFFLASPLYMHMLQ